MSLSRERLVVVGLPCPPGYAGDKAEIRLDTEDGALLANVAQGFVTGRADVFCPITGSRLFHPDCSNSEGLEDRREDALNWIVENLKEPE